MADRVGIDMAERTCRGCDTVIVPGPRERNPKIWCSASCLARTKRATGQRPKVPRIKTYREVWYGTCEICGQLWCGQKMGHKSATCAREDCRKELKNRRSRARYAADPVKDIERARMQRATRTDEEREKEFERVRAWWASRPEAMCAVCGKPTGKGLRERRQVCSNACRYALLPPRKRKPKPLKVIQPRPHVIKVACQRCATVFETDIHTKRYCSKRCKNNKDCQVSTIRQATCQRCAQEFTTDRSWQLHCSPRCAHRAARDRREAAKRTNSSAVVGRVNRGAVYKRDGFTCQLCGYPTNPDVKVPDYEAPTIDHIIPLARGGSHTMDNVQTAHFLCNMLKGDSLAS
jgi:5-methylcytosine-specific restriction endonuclease McrA